MIKETDPLTLLRKDDDEDEGGFYSPSPEEKKKIRHSFLDFLAMVGAAIIAAQQMGLYDSAQEGARAGGGGLTPADIAAAIAAAADFNAEHFSGLRDDANEALNALLDGDFRDQDSFTGQLADLMDSIASRAERYAKGGGNKAWGYALRRAGEENGLDGGTWDCHFGEGSCDDCMGLHGQFLSWDEWENTYQQTQCNGGCTCGFHAAENPESLADDIGPEEEVA